ncbi:ABC transporter ATP-binding protein [Parvibium lacunae]|uniref:ABC transporter ATP-binding protein n=1 Tax=Parvibium lacunae TaxID=1888893 RepID=A0A368L3G5_9BURK|nr:ABC transporter ATP-binding protein [Parvibium lacunae]RCS58128.1 ABC transporter ATP-binding protein [Parvibium lacunae]
MSSTDTLAIRLSQLRYSWPQQQQACIDIPVFTVAQGERVFLHGPSGSGKSTLLALLGGVARPQSGTIHLLGTDLTRLPSATCNRFRADHIGFIFQQFNLLPWLSAMDNVLLPGTFSARRRHQAGDLRTQAQHLLTQLDLSQALWHCPASSLSVGQQQRVAAARALIGKPEIVIADEPTSALDDARQQAFINLLLAEASSVNATLLFVSHDARLATHFDRTVALADINQPNREPA